MRQNRRVAPIVLPAGLETFISQHVGHDDILEACPLALVCLAARRNEVSRFEPNPQPPPNRRWVTKSGFHPSVQEIKRSRFHEGSGKAPAVLDRIGAFPGFDTRDSPCPFSSFKTKAFRSCEQSMRNDRRGMDSYWFDFRKTSTDAPAIASTPGKECLTGQERVAKGILSSISIFRARSRPPASASGTLKA